jgi:hypothetical protein
MHVWLYLISFQSDIMKKDLMPKIGFGLQLNSIFNGFYFFFFIYNSTWISSYNRIGGVMVNMLASSAVHRGFETRSGQTKDYKIGICCFSAKDWLVQNQNNVSEWSNMSTSGLLFQWASTIKIQISMLV